ncbi:MAG: GAF domain-containing protein, partial [Dehalococcoidia bacterium]
MLAPNEDDAGVWLHKLSRVMARVTFDSDRQGVLSALADGLVEEFDAALARIWLYDPGDNAMHARATAGSVRDYSGSSETIPLTGVLWPIARAMLNREVVVIEEIGPDSGIRDLAWAQREGLRSFAGFPLILDDRLVGAMVVYRHVPLRPVVRDALALLAQQAALA